MPQNSHIPFAHVHQGTYRHSCCRLSVCILLLLLLLLLPLGGHHPGACKPSAKECEELQCGVLWPSHLAWVLLQEWRVLHGWPPRPCKSPCTGRSSSKVSCQQVAAHPNWTVNCCTNSLQHTRRQTLCGIYWMSHHESSSPTTCAWHQSEWQSS